MVWKPAVRNLVQLFVEKTPSTHKFETEISISWVFDEANPQFIDL